MSEQDAEIVRRQWEEIARQSPMRPKDLSRLVGGIWHPNILYEEDPRWPGSASYDGLERVQAVFEGYSEVMGSPTVRLERVVDAGEEQVALVRLTGTSPGSDVPWEHVWAYRCRLRDGKVSYLRAYWDPDEALTDAGVSSP